MAKISKLPESNPTLFLDHYENSFSELEKANTENSIKTVAAVAQGCTELMLARDTLTSDFSEANKHYQRAQASYYRAMKFLSRSDMEKLGLVLFASYRSSLKAQAETLKKYADTLDKASKTLGGIVDELAPAPQPSGILQRFRNWLNG